MEINSFKEFHDCSSHKFHLFIWQVLVSWLYATYWFGVWDVAVKEQKSVRLFGLKLRIGTPCQNSVIINGVENAKPKTSIGIVELKFTLRFHELWKAFGYMIYICKVQLVFVEGSVYKNLWEK